MVLQKELDKEVTFYASQAFSGNTKRTYRCHRQSYINFCVRIGCSPVPVTNGTICRYASYLARSMKYNSIKQYLNIIRLLHLEWGLPNPLHGNFTVNSVMRGIRRHLGDQVSRKKPITPDLLKEILRNLDIKVSFDATVWATCLIMFYGLLRKSNTLVNSESEYDVNKHIRRSDAVFYKWGIIIRIRYSKVIQFQSRIIDLPLPRVRDNPLCPVSAMFNALSLSGTLPPDSPAFSYRIGSQVKILTAPKFIRRIRQCLGPLSVDISNHSYRRGGATFMYRIGLSPEDIRLLGDWKSSCYQRYINNDTDTRLRLISTMLKNV